MSHFEQILTSVAARSSSGESRELIVPAVPVARCAIAVRPATVKDVPFIDGLQKMHGHMVGWMPTKQIEGKIALGQVVVAWASRPCASGSSRECMGETPMPLEEPVGYCISHDQYMGRDDVGVIYQLNVAPLKQRHLIGATLIKSVFERAAYGCRLFCLWCAQDIQANYFWEAIGFVPLAFRTGSAAKQRIHIFWQRRIREGDTTTPYWFPAQTKSGAIREDRIVLPIPPGTHWRDAKPIVLPGIPEKVQPTLPPTRPPESKKPFVPKAPVVAAPSKHLKQIPKGKAAVVTASGIKYLDRADHVPEPEPVKPKREKKPRAKNDPKLVSAARELRDRYLEQINADPGAPGLPAGKYDVSRALAGPGSAVSINPAPPKQLPHAA